MEQEHNKTLSNYENILVMDEQGRIIFYDMADLNVLRSLGLWPEEFMGKRVTTPVKSNSNSISHYKNNRQLNVILMKTQA